MTEEANPDPDKSVCSTDSQNLPLPSSVFEISAQLRGFSCPVGSLQKLTTIWSSPTVQRTQRRAANSEQTRLASCPKCIKPLPDKLIPPFAI